MITTNPAIRPTLAELRAAAERSGFFAHHGIWAPGVRLFRNLQFTAKALIISAAFAIPSGLMACWLLYTQAETCLLYTSGHRPGYARRQGDPAAQPRHALHPDSGRELQGPGSRRAQRRADLRTRPPRR